MSEFGHNSGEEPETMDENPEMADLLGDIPEPVKKPTLAKVHLDSIVDRLISIDEEVKNLRSDAKDIMAEAKSAGFDKYGITEILKMKKMDAEKFANREEVRDLYIGSYLED